MDLHNTHVKMAWNQSVLKFVFLLGFACLLHENVSAQRWKTMRYEAQYGIGAGNFLGDLGGANQIGTHYFKDFEWVETRPAICIGMRYKLTEFFALKSALTFGQMRGDDKLTDYTYRNYRNLSFKSNILEFATQFEASFYREQLGHRYRLRGIKGQKGFELYSYGFLGLGAFYFNPQGQDKNGNWVSLQPLGTEGQGLVPTRQKYNRVQICIPIGIGFKYTINQKWGIGIEYGLRYTFTDYIDDVSTTYFSSDKLRAVYGKTPDGKDAYVSNASGIFSIADKSNKNDPSKMPITAAGQQRGDPRFTDSYMFLMITLNHKIKTGRNNLPKF